ncbi:hypothetical protein N7468_008091 [Penicillium chermesinum]|uniref:Poly [ADP-ribose] polymerase n=1 Tax=Penicillium chermesinum TaxID=63820 RepID=A0A9W9TIB8_9EURO|nr:uncharacterized protein N7468_008091 [Penicillium chermesinum]KAJ5223549.1 hypothetical protein N7468_008091 [Penicillium chermesinum]KAJ6155621.1 hypothetical protein N7470_006187 [Penicillium chermesinum]
MSTIPVTSTSSKVIDLSAVTNLANAPLSEKSSDFLQGVVIAVTHELIREMPPGGFSWVQEVTERHGGKFAGFNQAGCTHLISAKEYSGRLFHHTRTGWTSAKKKTYQCVDLTWLSTALADLSLSEGQVSPPTSLKDTDSSPMQPNSSKRKLEDIPEPCRKRQKDAIRSKPFLTAIVDECCQGRGYSVFMDDDAVYEATLVCYDEYGPHIDLCHMQVLWKGDTDQYGLWTGTEVVAPYNKYQRVTNRSASGHIKQHFWKRSGKKETVVARFRRLFKEYTGLIWEDRHKPPKKNKWLLIKPQYEDIEAELSARVTKTSLEPGIREVFEAISEQLTHQFVTRLIETVSEGRFKEFATERHQHYLRTGIHALRMLSGLSENDSLVKDLAQVYEFLVWPDLTFMGFGLPLLSSPGMIQSELKNLMFLQNLKFMQALVSQPSLQGPAQIAPQLHRILGLKGIKRVDFEEFQRIKSYFVQSSVGTVKDKQVLGIYRIERQSEADHLKNFRKSHPDKAGRSLLLWHGSILRNFLGILGQGLRRDVLSHITDSSVGTKWRSGIFFADLARKSMYYCKRKNTRTAIILLCEVEVGKKVNSIFTFHKHAEKEMAGKGEISVHLNRGNNEPIWWLDAGTKFQSQGLRGIRLLDLDNMSHKALRGHAHEHIVYDESQIRMRYMIHFQTG